MLYTSIYYTYTHWKTAESAGVKELHQEHNGISSTSSTRKQLEGNHGIAETGVESGFTVSAQWRRGFKNQATQASLQ